MSEPTIQLQIPKVGEPTVNAVPVSQIERPARPVFKNKTQAINAIIVAAGIVSQFYPPASEFVKQNAVTILSLVGAGNFILRFWTHGKVTLFGADTAE